MFMCIMIGASTCEVLSARHVDRYEQYIAEMERLEKQMQCIHYLARFFPLSEPSLVFQT